jgi:hypothetical protein
VVSTASDACKSACGLFANRRGVSLILLSPTVAYSGAEPQSARWLEFPKRGCTTFEIENGASLFQIGRARGHATSYSIERFANPSDAGAHAIASDGAARFVPPSTRPPANDPAPRKEAPDQGMPPFELRSQNRQAAKPHPRHRRRHHQGRRAPTRRGAS